MTASGWDGINSCAFTTVGTGSMPLGADEPITGLGCLLATSSLRTPVQGTVPAQLPSSDRCGEATAYGERIAEARGACTRCSVSPESYRHPAGGAGSCASGSVLGSLFSELGALLSKHPQFWSKPEASKMGIERGELQDCR